MAIVIRMEGEKGLWKHTGVPFARVSTAGPAPSHLVGIAGAALGFVGREPPPKPKRGEILTRSWALPKDLERFVIEEDLHVGMAWCGLEKRPVFRRHNVNGWKKTSGEGRVRIDQTLVWKPAYRFAFWTKSKEGEELLAGALSNPVFRTFFGASFCPAFITHVDVVADGASPDGVEWAVYSEDLNGSVTPLTRHILPYHPSHGRLASDGFVDYFPQSPGNKISWFKAWTPQPAEATS